MDKEYKQNVKEKGKRIVIIKEKKIHSKGKREHKKGINSDTS